QIGHGYFLELEEFHCGWLPLGELRGTWKGPRKFYESPALIGCALAVGRELYENLGGFDSQMRYWGVEDLDFGLKSWLMGCPILHDPDAVIGHRFRAAFDNFSVPMEHLLANQLRMARKNFTEATWSDWVDRCRARHVGRIADHPEGLWALAWELFQAGRASVEHERTMLLGHRPRDEFWYAERFGLEWPRLAATAAGSLPQALFAEPSPSPSPSPSPPPPGKTILISGYWPPTNSEQPNGMLNQFKSAAIGTLGEYIIDNYDNTGYGIVTIATEFPGKGNYVPGQDKNWGGGAGAWQVDYPLTSDTFWKLMKKYTPIAVMTTSRRKKEKTWLLEIGSTNLKRSDWEVSPPWNQGRPPYIGGSATDPAKLMGPNAGHGPVDGEPPDATEVAGFEREASAATKGLQTTIKAALAAKFAAADLDPQIATVVQGTAPDNYVSAYAGYHAVWYDAWKDSCKAGWHTHVDYDITLANATKAIKIQLDELIKWLDTQ
ncbi:MAG TPA: galactosyltransferase-related protein, partial [Pirellulales bacterium]|nr:galactosyltransferase-related protein [Pirellulales bacterium]